MTKTFYKTRVFRLKRLYGGLRLTTRQYYDRMNTLNERYKKENQQTTK